MDFHQENCIGCGYCVTACPFDVPRISEKDSKAYKCTMCSDRVAVNQAPACAKACPTGAIQFGAKEDMKDYADKRIADLKERGFDKAGLYDPPRRRRYARHVRAAPCRPARCTPTCQRTRHQPHGVAVERGRQTPGHAGTGRVALGSLFHYVTKGPERGLERDRGRD